MLPPSLHIGDLRLSLPLVLAPMSGVTDSPFRRMIKQANGEHVGLMVSEFIKVETLTGRSAVAVIRLAFHASERPVSIQIYGADPGPMAEAARIIEAEGADAVDINAGCPAPRVVRRGGGAALLKDPPQLGRLIEAVRGAVAIPVTVKVRNGWCERSINALETLKIVESSGATAIAVHGRTRVQMYRGEADWDIVARMRQAARIPVLGSGDVVTPAGAVARLRDGSCDGVLIGRAAITNPWIFRQSADAMAGRAPYQPTWRDKLVLLRAYRDSLARTYPDKVAPGRVKMMLSRLIKGFPDAAEVRLACLRMGDPDAMLDHLEGECRRRGVLDIALPSAAAA